MLTYNYKCNNKSCNHEQEHKQKITEDKLKVCPKCNQETYERLISKNSNSVIFNGIGWFNKGGY